MNYNAILKEENKVLNHEGAESFRMTPEMELYTAAVTASLSDKFYESRNEFVERVAKLIPKVDPVFVAQLAIYTRHQMNLRSIPLFLLVELAKCHNGDNLVSKAVARTVSRADEITELLMCYQWRNPSSGVKKLGKLSRQIQNGLKEAFNNFDEYQFAKYNRDSEVKLRDALFLVHPRAKSEEQQAIFDKIVSDTLAVPYTWETQLSSLGQQKFESNEEKDAAVRSLWEELIDSGKLGYMALLRNLRNILQAGIDAAHVEKICKRLSDPVQVGRSKQLPFRFLSAYREISTVKSEYTSAIIQSLEEAVKVSISNVDGFDMNTNVLVAADVSGSMQQPVSARSTVQYYDIAILLSMLLKTRCQSVISGMFGDTWKVINLPKDSILANTVEMHRREGEVGYSTNGHKVIEYLIENNKRMDKVMIFTDCQMWDSKRNRWIFSDGSIVKSWHIYKEKNPDAKLYLFDLAGYGQTPLNLVEKDVFLIAGWNEKIFDVLQAIENGSEVLDIVKTVKI